MTPEVDKIARKIARRFWNDTLKDDSIVNPGFHHLMENSTKNPLEQEVPEEHRNEWLQAMKLMSEYGVFEIVVWQPVNSRKPALLYKISNFSHERFVGFCRDFNINLSHNQIDKHTAVLHIESDNEVVIDIDGAMEYRLPPLHKGTLVDMLKIALQPSLRGVPMTKEKLNAEGSRPEVAKKILKNRKFKIPDSVKHLKKYRYGVKFPKFLDEFYILTDADITAKTVALIDEETLEEIKELADYRSSK